MALLNEIDGDLITYWKTKSGITDLVGTGNDARIYPDGAPQGTTAAHVEFIEAAGGEAPRHLSGGNAVRFAVVHVYALASTRSGANALSEAIRQQTENFRGTMGDTYVNDVRAGAPNTGVDNPKDGSDQKLYWTRTVYEFTHAVTAAG